MTLKKYTMVIALVAVFLIFTASTGGKILYPQNITNLLSQNTYVFVLGVGMLLCILTGGNIDLSVGSVLLDSICKSSAIHCYSFGYVCFQGTCKRCS